ncbi:MAG TPA: pyridoxamine 5'-phosphate oxidase family protein [Blastocatellia bacterium]|jgi:Predicted flavin-nucleotide-binding protein|nr:pyridoxamine 5'-phosphate oxidase family protein [Blastocatellia bacterium]
MPANKILESLSDPVAQELLNSRIPARLAYTGLDGSARVVPIWFHWDGRQLVLGSAPSSPKVTALSRNGKVALTIDEDTYPPKVLLVRGLASVEIIEGVVPEYGKAARRYLGEEEGSGWEQQARGMFKQMARIAIEPEWVKILDFQTRFPSAIEKAIGGADQES